MLAAAGAGREWLSVRGAMAAFQQWHSRVLHIHGGELTAPPTCSPLTLNVFKAVPHF